MGCCSAGEEAGERVFGSFFLVSPRGTSLRRPLGPLIKPSSLALQSDIATDSVMVRPAPNSIKKQRTKYKIASLKPGVWQLVTDAGP